MMNNSSHIYVYTYNCSSLFCQVPSPRLNQLSSLKDFSVGVMVKITDGSPRLAIMAAGARAGLSFACVSVCVRVFMCVRVCVCVCVCECVGRG